MNPDGTGRTRITNNTFDGRQPSWQPIPVARDATCGPRVRARPLPWSRAYRPCKYPNRMHGPPLSSASCSPPKLYSRYLTVGTPDANGKTADFTGFVRIDVDRREPGDPGRRGGRQVQIKINDVRKTVGPHRLHGPAARESRVPAVRPTRRTPFGNGSPHRCRNEHRRDVGWSRSSAPRPRTPPSAPTATSRPRVTRSRPGSIKESKRAIWTLGPHPGVGRRRRRANSTADNDLFLTQGLFVP